MSPRLIRTSLALTAVFSLAAAHSASPPLVVHEWGTFTSFQDVEGRTIAGINVDDEPVPPFVHRLRDFQTFRTTSMPARWSQGAPRCHPDVTMRLETPVVYFYPPAGWQPESFDVRAAFAGGWLTEFYPAAVTEGMDVQKVINSDARGSLLWQGIKLDSSGAAWMPQTTSHVWLAPRKVDAAIVVSPEAKQAEKYLFYRGVGHLDAPIQVRQSEARLKFALRAGEPKLAILPRLWVVQVGSDKGVSYQVIQPSSRTASVPDFVSAGSHVKTGLDSLRRELADALTAQGLFPNEAAAMLETWRLSYFESEGLRVFFLLPQEWTEARLPLSISTPSDITRVMVGRIELVTAQQRAVQRQLYALSDASFPTVPLYFEENRALELMRHGNHSHSELYRAVGREVPESLQLYESLGRFRDALLAHEWQLSQVPAERARLERILQSFGACAANLPARRVSDPAVTSAK